MGSYNIGKPEAVKWIRAHVPETARVLDVGACDGKWVALLPEYKNVEAVEVWEPYIERYGLKDKYKTVTNCDIRDYQWSGTYDLAIFGDVLEHLSVEEAQDVLAKASLHCRAVVVCVPFLYPQGEANGNPHERHVQDDLTEALVRERYPGLQPLVLAQNYGTYVWRRGLRIYLAVPTYENVTPDTFMSLWDMDRGGCEVVLAFVRGYDCAAARNRIVQNAMEVRADYVMMCDSDTVVPRHALTAMLEDPVDVCFGVCARRTGANLYDGITNMFKEGEFNYSVPFMYRAEEVLKLREAGKKKIRLHGGGLGLALIRTDVFRRISRPPFKWVEYGNGSALSEDLYFCEECRKARIPVHMDVRVLCGHVFRHVQNVE